MSKYDAKAVQAEIDKANRKGGKGRISSREAKLIHALLKGRH